MKKPIVELLFERAVLACEMNSSVVNWAKQMGVALYKNQIEIINTICDEKHRNITILAARSAGKTYAVALGTTKMCIDNPDYEVIFFAPKAAQATRILEQIQSICHKCKDTLYKEIDWANSNKADFKFFNGSRMRALGAADGTQVEGYHAPMVVIDEAHAVSSEFYNKKISPMLKAASNPKVIKIGISLFRNHFYESCHNPTWTNLVFPWDKCENLFNAGTTTIDGVDYPTTIINDMPLSYKQERFPNHKEYHFPSENNISEEDFDTQYEMKWVDSISKFLTDKDLESMVGEHKYMQVGVEGEEYYFGLDLAGGLLINQGIKRDYSSLVIVRKHMDGMKEVVRCEEWQGDIVDQMEEIVAMIHPTEGRFKCRFGTADYGSLGPAVVDILSRSGLPIAGIRYRASEPSTGMPYKMALFDNLFTELRSGYFKYPCEHDMATNYLLKKHMEEWSALERKVNTNGNIQIAAPANTDEHDDACNACVLAVWAADKMQDELRRITRRGLLERLVSPNISGSTTMNRFSQGGANRNMPAGLRKYWGGNK